jgi:predicted AlkP superfamily pyrophosphatase or phosphodiesterase
LDTPDFVDGNFTYRVNPAGDDFLSCQKMEAMFRALVFLMVFCACGAYAQQRAPKLVVGIVVDQMRQEYLYRFDPKFGPGGFKRLVSEGFSLRNAHYNYIPTETGPGHASIYTGTTPAAHGIIGNDWYDRSVKKEVNCVGDENHKAVGASGGGMVSPHRLATTTITDELKLFTQRRAKVVGVSIKDRGAVLPAGHNPDGAYWFDARSGNFVTSTYYKAALPVWVDQFNARKRAEHYIRQDWATVLPADQYRESGPDDTPYETRLRGKERSNFPYKLSELRKANGEYELLLNTPFGNDLVLEMAKAALEGESLGADAVPDFLSVSLSSTDRIGHAMGPNSVEIEDTYIRLDRQLEDFLNVLDQTVGKGEYLVFLTSDHGVAEVPQYMKDLKMPGGYFRPAFVQASLNDFLRSYFPDKNIVESVSTEQVYINHDVFKSDLRTAGVDLMIATQLIEKFLLATEGVAAVYPRSVLQQSAFNEGGPKGHAVRGFHPKRSGDLMFALESGWLVWGGITGSTHGSGYTYDTHVPVIFFGAGVKAGSTVRHYEITDIAPTLAMLLNIRLPSASTGKPVAEIFE